MLVNARRSVHQIIQEVNHAIDDSKGFDQKVIDLAKKALLEIDSVAFITSSDELAFSSIASRIGLLAQVGRTKEEESWFSKVFSLVDAFLGNDAISVMNQDLKDSLAEEFFSKGKFISNEALQIEAVLSKYPKLRAQIIREAYSSLNKGMSIEDRVSILKRIGEEKMNLLVESVKVSAAQDGGAVSENIQNYGIRDQNALVEIAKIAAARSGWGVSLFIKNYGIVDQNSLADIAKIAAAKDARGVSLCIRNYGITAQNSLADIAKIAAAQNGAAVSDQIKEYGITDQNALIEIAKIVAAQSLSGVSYYIRNYGITDQNALMEIAKIAATKDGGNVSVYIKNYGITDENRRIEIAKIAAARSGWAISVYIRNYGITDQNALIEIAKIAAARNVGGILEYIRNYGIVDPNARIDILKIAIFKDPLNVMLRMNNFELNKSGDDYKRLVLYGLLYGFVFRGQEFMIFPEIISEFSPFLIRKSGGVAEETGHLEREKKPRAVFSSFLQINAMHILQQGLWNPSERNSILREIASYRNSSIAGSLAFHLFNESSHREFKDSYLFFVLEKTKKGAFKDEFLVHKILPSIVLAKWLAQAKREGLLSFAEEKTISDLSSFITQSRKEFRNNFSPLTQTFLQTSLDLDKARGLSSKRKLQILFRICSQENHIKGLGLIRSLLVRNEIEALNVISLENPIHELKEIFEEALLKDRYVNLGGIENLADKYLCAFENTRTPFALETYTANLSRLGDEKVKETLNLFVRSVLEESFEEERYRIDNNIHLQKIHEYDQEKGTFILKRWKGLSFEVPVAATSERPEEQAFSFEDFFRQKLEDGHGRKDGKEVLKYLSDFLKGNSESRVGILEDLTQRVETEKANIVSESDPSEKARLSRLLKLDQVQKNCIELITNFDLSKSEQITKLESILSVNLDIELANDLKGLSNGLRAPKRSSSLEKVEFCKGWEDLFLSGTEVAGSCQRIDGDPDLNKCLLAYSLDGKNSMLAVKGIDGKIIARSMLRLLWDERESKPVLFLDRLYPSPSTKERAIFIQMAAKECSRELGLELFGVGNVGIASQKVIKSLGSSCPYEYADGAEGVMENGVYTLKGVIEIR